MRNIKLANRLDRWKIRAQVEAQALDITNFETK